MSKSLRSIDSSVVIRPWPATSGRSPCQKLGGMKVTAVSKVPGRVPVIVDGLERASRSA